jgi:hypothetical protein
MTNINDITKLASDFEQKLAQHQYNIELKELSNMLREAGEDIYAAISATGSDILSYYTESLKHILDVWPIPQGMKLPPQLTDPLLEEKYILDQMAKRIPLGSFNGESMAKRLGIVAQNIANYNYPLRRDFRNSLIKPISYVISRLRHRA